MILKLFMQKTKYSSSCSQSIDVRLGLPQGTALSVVLFIMYINDIAKIPIHCKIILFADDTVIYIQANDINDAIMKLNEDLYRIYQWLNTNKLSLNVKKTKCMVINEPRNGVLNEVYINGQLIERVHSIKYLGIQIDNELKFSHQIDNVGKKAAMKVNLLKRISPRLTFDTK